MSISALARFVTASVEDAAAWVDEAPLLAGGGEGLAGEACNVNVKGRGWVLSRARRSG